MNMPLSPLPREAFVTGHCLASSNQHGANSVTVASFIIIIIIILTNFTNYKNSHLGNIQYHTATHIIYSTTVTYATYNTI